MSGPNHQEEDLKTETVKRETSGTAGTRRVSLGWEALYPLEKKKQK